MVKVLAASLPLNVLFECEPMTCVLVSLFTPLLELKVIVTLYLYAAFDHFACSVRLLVRFIVALSA